MKKKLIMISTLLFSSIYPQSLIANDKPWVKVEFREKVTQLGNQAHVSWESGRASACFDSAGKPVTLNGEYSITRNKTGPYSLSIYCKNAFGSTGGIDYNWVVHGHGGNISSNRYQSVGGGSKYSQIVQQPDSEDPCHSVSDYDTLESCLANSVNDDIVFVKSDAEILIKMNETSGLTVPKGVTLASDRGFGASIGAALVFKEASDKKVFRGIRMESGSRLTGFRIKGPKKTPYKVDNEILRNPVYHSTGAVIVGYDFGFDPSNGIKYQGETTVGVRIDNNHIYNWTYYGVGILHGAKSITIENNIINDINKKNGYAVLANGTDTSRPEYTSTSIISNAFFNNWHDIASSGHAGTGYLAAYNIVFDGFKHEGWRFNKEGKKQYFVSEGHGFDMHGCIDRDNTCEYGKNRSIVDLYNPSYAEGFEDVETDAGHYLKIIHNIFSYTDHNREGIRVRGIPKHTSLVYDNYFSHSKFVGGAIDLRTIQIDAVSGYPLLNEKGNIKIKSMTSQNEDHTFNFNLENNHIR